MDDFETFWNKGVETNHPDGHGGFHRVFRLKLPAGKQFMTHAEVVERVQQIRRFFNQHKPGGHELQVAVRDRNIGSWRGGKFTSTASEEVYVWSPDDYDKSTGNDAATPEELEATEIAIYFRNKHST